MSCENIKCVEKMVEIVNVNLIQICVHGGDGNSKGKVTNIDIYSSA